MKEGRYRLVDKEDLTGTGRLFRLRFDAPEIEGAPGQFVNIEVPGKYLRRPISVSEYEDGVLSLIVQVVGEGTRRIVETPVGRSLDMLTGLGNRFTLPPKLSDRPGRCILVIGGGVGYAPLVGLMKMLVRDSACRPLAVFGFNGAEDIPSGHIRSLRGEGFDVECCTMSGASGFKGNAVEVAVKLMHERNLVPEYFYTCGPMPMMKALCRQMEIDGQLSLEARMGCGFGACMGCSIQTAFGPARICKEGPVFTKSSLTDFLKP